MDVVLGVTLFAGIVALAGWGAVALSWRWKGPVIVRRILVATWLLAAAAWLAMLWLGSRFAPVVGMAVQMTILLVWWRRLRPAADLDWAEDVAHLATGRVEDHELALDHVRCFDWRTRDEADVAWESRRYPLSQLSSLDMFVSGWGRPGIAHVLLSFGFSPPGGDEWRDAQFLAISVEVRRERHERFSEFGGFFKQYELAVIAADERDAVRLRSNVRGEKVTLYRVMLSARDRQDLLLALVEEANRLERSPRFYHTITANCTTLVFSMMRRIIEGLPVDHRVLLSGLLPGYVHDHGGLVEGVTLAELKRCGDITQRAQAADRAEDFSQRIRRGVPGWTS